MTPQPAIRPEAESEIAKEYTYYFVRSERVAANFLNEIEVGLAKIAEAPLRNPVYLHGTRKIRLRRFPHSIVYFPTETGALVIAISHGKRRQDYWISRL